MRNSCLSASLFLRWSTSPASPLPLIVTFPEAFDLSIAVVPLLLAIQCQQCAHKSLKGKNPAAYIHRNHESSYLRGMRFVAFLLFFLSVLPLELNIDFPRSMGRGVPLGCLEPKAAEGNRLPISNSHSSIFSNWSPQVK